MVSHLYPLYIIESNTLLRKSIYQVEITLRQSFDDKIIKKIYRYFIIKGNELFHNDAPMGFLGISYKKRHGYQYTNKTN